LPTVKPLIGWDPKHAIAKEALKIGIARFDHGQSPRLIYLQNIASVEQVLEILKGILL